MVGMKNLKRGIRTEASNPTGTIELGETNATTNRRVATSANIYSDGSS